jgi:hypothetical protein
MLSAIQCIDIAGIVLVEMIGLPMTGETHILATAPVATPPARELAPKAAAPPTHASVDPKPAAPVASTPAQVSPPPSFPVTLQFDQAAHRFFIEARDSSGLVVLQIPFKAAVAATASAPAPSARGQRVNSKA